MKPGDLTLRILLGLVALSNIAVGLLGVIPGIDVSKIATLFYSAVLMVTPQLEHVTQMFGAYMLTLGILADLLLRIPLKTDLSFMGLFSCFSSAPFSGYFSPLRHILFLVFPALFTGYKQLSILPLRLL